MTFPLNFIQATDSTTLLIALISAISGVIVSLGLGGIILWFLNKGKFFAEVKQIAGKNEEQDIKNFEFENDVLDKAKAVIDKLRLENLNLETTNHKLTQDVQIKTLEIAKEKGKTEQALKDRDTVYERIEELEQKLLYEHNNCQQQIVELGLRYEAKFNAAIAHIDLLKALLENAGIKCPELVIPDVPVFRNGTINGEKK